jgi:hypothetical protein
VPALSKCELLLNLRIDTKAIIITNGMAETLHLTEDSLNIGVSRESQSVVNSPT